MPTDQAKENAFYSAVVGAWANNPMALDKALITLSRALFSQDRRLSLRRDR